MWIQSLCFWLHLFSIAMKGGSAPRPNLDDRQRKIRAIFQILFERVAPFAVSVDVPEHGHRPTTVVRLISKYDGENPLQVVPLVATGHKFQQIRQPVFGIHPLQEISTNYRHPPVKPIPQVLLIVKVEERPAVVETSKQPLLRLDIVPVVVGKVPQRDVLRKCH